ncbi:MAG: anti-sigma factor antagonist [Deltaproteobacteria bacterium]|nr:MAG: anti-sigma factor antagonist [Deltaproteobacteria bacterium]
MELITEKQSEVVVFKLKGRLDALTAPEFEQKCLKWLETGESRFAVDLGELEYISSAGIRSILLIAKRLKAQDGGLAFSRISGMVEKVFNIAGIYSLFPMCASLDEAAAQLKP